MKSFLDFITEYYEEQVGESGEKRSFEKYLAEIDINELLEIADLYGTSRFHQGAMSWKLAFPDITINDIPELKALNR